MTPADKLSSGVVTVPPKAPTRLPGTGRCSAVTIWNRTGYDLGVGGPELATDQMLPDGGSFRVPVRTPCGVYLLTLAAPGDVEVAFTIEE